MILLLLYDALCYDEYDQFILLLVHHFTGVTNLVLANHDDHVVFLLAYHEYVHLFNQQLAIDEHLIILHFIQLHAIFFQIFAQILVILLFIRL
jgi:hypothetical protein